MPRHCLPAQQGNVHDGSVAVSIVLSGWFVWALEVLSRGLLNWEEDEEDEELSSSESSSVKSTDMFTEQELTVLLEMDWSSSSIVWSISMGSSLDVGG